MADIFISYAREDRAAVARLAAALESNGYSVWWDKNLAGGAEFVKETEAELKAAKAVVVAWSADSQGSHWVADEAEAGRDTGRLVPISLDGAGPPLGFRQYQTIDFSEWAIGREEPFKSLVGAIEIKTKASARPPVGAAPPSASKRSKRMIAAVAAALVAAVAVGVFAVLTGGEQAKTAHNEPVAEKLQSIAVLPFTDMSEARDQEYFADGIADEILNALARIEGLRVTGRTSSFSFKGRNETLSTIGDTLKVAHILEGSVRKQGKRVRITAQLIRVEDSSHLWSETYDGDLTDIFDLQERIARDIAGALKVVLSGGAARLVARATDDPEAYGLFLQGRALLLRRIGDNLPNAIKLFEQAVARDPDFARAWSGLAAAYATLDNYVAAADTSASAAAARANAGKALALDPDLAEPHAVLAYIDLKYRDYVGMRRSFDIALALDPSDPTTILWAGIGRLFVGEIRAARANFDRLEALDPFWALGLLWRANAAGVDNDWERAEELAGRGLALGNSSAHITTAEAAGARGDVERAAMYFVEAFREGGFVSSDFTLVEIDLLGRGAWGDATDRERALAIIDPYLSQDAESPEILVSYALLHMGDPRRAFATFEAAESRFDQHFYRALWSKAGREARQHKDFPAFAARVGLLDYWKTYGWPDRCRPAPDAGADSFECD